MVTFALCVALMLGSADAEAQPFPAEELKDAGVLLGDRDKLWNAWEAQRTPPIAAALTDSWLFELGAVVEEELVGSSLFLEVLSTWEDQEPDNALVPCLREVFRAARESHLPDWSRLAGDIGWRRRIFFHYLPARKATLRFILERRGNTVESWMRWLGHMPLTNAERVTQLVQSSLLEARFLLLTGGHERARELIDLAGRIAEMIVAEDDEIELRKLSLQAAVDQERMLGDLVAGDAAELPKRIAAYRELLGKERELLGRLSVLTTIQGELVEAYRDAYQQARPLSWDGLASVDAATMERFADAYERAGTRAIASFWKCREVPLDDFTAALEEHLDLFREKEVTRASAGKLMDYLRSAAGSERGVPTWVIPAAGRVFAAYRNAAGLGRATATGRGEEAFRILASSLAYLAVGEEDETKLIELFRRGVARPYLLLAFAKRKVVAAAPIVAEQFLAIAGEAPEAVLLDYIFCLRALTGKDFGLDVGDWRAWYEKQGVKKKAD